MAEDPKAHVIDDDEAVRNALAFLFECAEVQSQSYNSALAFLDVAPGLPAGCIVTDVRMPDMDGLALQRRLLELGVFGCR